MKNFTFKLAMIMIVGLLGLQNPISAQSSITIDASQVYSNFRFIDSLAVRDNSYSGAYSGAYSLGYRHTGTKGLLLSANIGMRKGGATMVIDNSNYEWNLQYMNLKVGAGYIYRLAKLGLYATASPYVSYLLRANQRINNENFDIKKTKSIQNLDMGLIGTLGTQLTVSDFIAVYGEVNYLMGLYNIEGSSRGNTFAWQKANGEQAYNRAFSATLGVSFTIK